MPRPFLLPKRITAKMPGPFDTLCAGWIGLSELALTWASRSPAEDARLTEMEALGCLRHQQVGGQTAEEGQAWFRFVSQAGRGLLR
jgi:hypothetical protein